MSDNDDYSDGEDEVPLAKRSGRPRNATPADDGQYRMKGALKPPRPTSYTTQALFDQMIAGDIDTNPDYQRDVVWPETKQMGLIDSIFRNFYVPPLIFSVTYRDDGSERRISIDGKQRLTSIRRFMQGEILFKDPNTGEKFAYEDIGAFKGIKVFSERYRKIFRTKQIVCIEYQDLSNSSEREIFQRVQLGMALTAAEKLQAIASPMGDFIHELQAQYVNPSDELGLSSLLDWDVTRGNDFRCLVHSAHSVERWPNVGTFPSPETLRKWLERNEEPVPKFTAGLHQTMEIFLMLAREQNGAMFRMTDVKKLAPAEFIAIVVLIHTWKAKLSASAFKKAIRDMRKGVREKEHDIRTNGRVMTLLWDFIKSLKPERYMGQDATETPVAKVRPLKRKRRQDEDDGMSVDSEDRNPPVKRKVEARDYSSLPTVSQAHAMASRPSPVPRPPSHSSGPPTPAPPAQAPRTAAPYPTPQAHDRLAALRAVREMGRDIPSSQSLSPYQPSPGAPFSPSQHVTSSIMQQQQGVPQTADAAMARMAAQQLMNSNPAWPTQLPGTQANGHYQPSQQPTHRY
ncbi:hypothetical protein EVJ58_g6897 [Rhodofomes roseus]|uniref:GmrSD restriction endonucleases N-terminal domain-containing protein n=1 Tax=Rhodofomes roseus TaxID=34475 RepID=A0A4Y9Y5C5_9APHY|nr:hypothetical protein EVJ58_g6897 [Rhodofomes roseus]